MKFLAIDDESQLVAYSHYFKLSGDEFIGTEDPQEGLRILQKNPDIDVIIVDMNPFGMSINVFAEEAKKIKRDIQFILVSGGEPRKYKNDFLAGAPFIQKPFGPGKLALAITPFRKPTDEAVGVWTEMTKPQTPRADVSPDLRADARAKGILMVDSGSNPDGIDEKTVRIIVNQPPPRLPKW